MLFYQCSSELLHLNCTCSKLKFFSFLTKIKMSLLNIIYDKYALCLQNKRTFILCRRKMTWFTLKHWSGEGYFDCSALKVLENWCRYDVSSYSVHTLQCSFHMSNSWVHSQYTLSLYLSLSLSFSLFHSQTNISSLFLGHQFKNYLWSLKEIHIASKLLKQLYISVPKGKESVFPWHRTSPEKL